MTIETAAVGSAERCRRFPASGNTWFVLVAVMTGFSLSILDATIVNLALPSMYEALQTDLSTASWILTAYNLTFTALLVVAGRCADRYGRKRIFVVGMCLFLLGSVACAFSSSVFALIAARVLQAIGAAALPTVSLTIIFQVFHEGNARRKALSVWGALSGLAAAAGPILGGLLLQEAGWRWIFLVNVPPCVLGIFLVFRFVPESYGSDSRSSLGVAQLVMSAVCVFCLILCILQGNGWGWTSRGMLALYGVTVIAFLGFFVVHHHATSPLFSAELFQKRSFTTTSLAMLLFCTALQGAYFVLPLYFITLQQESQLTAAFTMLAVPLTSFVLSALSGWLTAFSSRTKGASGLLLFALGLLLLCQLPPQVQVFDVVWREMMIGAGTGLCFANFPATALSDLLPHERGVGSGLFNTFRQLGLTLGVVLLVSILHGQSKQESMQLQHSAFVFTWGIAALIAFCGVPFALCATSPVHPLHGASDQLSWQQRTILRKGKMNERHETPSLAKMATGPYELVLKSEDTMRQLVKYLNWLHGQQVQSVLLILAKQGQVFQGEEDFEYLRRLQHPRTIPVVAGLVAPAGSEGACIKDLALKHEFPCSETRETALETWGRAIITATSSFIPHSVSKQGVQGPRLPERPVALLPHQEENFLSQPQRAEAETQNEPHQGQTPGPSPRVAVLLMMHHGGALRTPQVVTHVIGTLHQMGCEIILVPLVLPDTPPPLDLDGDAPFFKPLFEETLWPLLRRIDALHAGLCVCASERLTNKMDNAVVETDADRSQTREDWHVTVERSLLTLVKWVGIPVLLLKKTQQTALVQHERVLFAASEQNGRQRDPDDIPLFSLFKEFLSRCVSVHSVLVSTSRVDAYHWLCQHDQRHVSPLQQQTPSSDGQKRFPKEKLLARKRLQEMRGGRKSRSTPLVFQQNTPPRGQEQGERRRAPPPPRGKRVWARSHEQDTLFSRIQS